MIACKKWLDGQRNKSLGGDQKTEKNSTTPELRNNRNRNPVSDPEIRESGADSAEETLGPYKRLRILFFISEMGSRFESWSLDPTHTVTGKTQDRLFLVVHLVPHFLHF